jgi:hypothetical protein
MGVPQQKEIAKSQRDIAYEQIRPIRCYKIYDAAKASLRSDPNRQAEVLIWRIPVYYAK